MHFFDSILNRARSRLHGKGFDDPRLLGLLVLAIIGISVVWNGARVVQQNYGLLQRIAVLEEENRVLEIQNRNKEIQNEYYQSPEYAELKARRVNGKAANGERVYIITRENALSGLKTPEDTPEEVKIDEKPTYQKNFEAWIDFFFSKK